MADAAPPSPEVGLSSRALLTLWLTVCLDMVGFGIILPVLPFHAERYRASPALITWLASAFSIAQLVAAPALGRFGDRVGRRPVLLCSVAGWLALLFAARLLAGLCGANIATAQAYVVDRVDPSQSQRAAVLGHVGSAIGVGFVLGPTLGGMLLTPHCPTLPFWVALIGVTIVLSQGLLVGRTVALIGERKTLRLGLVVLGLSLATIGVAELPLVMAIGACGVALGNGLFAPALHALLSKSSEADRQGTNFGLASSAASVGRVLGPAGAGLVFQSCGPGWPALIGAAIVLLLACGNLRS